MANEMIERVAKAIQQASTPEGQARAAIAAMRAPTRDMLRAGILTMHHSSRESVYADDSLEAGYHAMIDKALGHALRVQHRL
jgi:hypothetical protein